MLNNLYAHPFYLVMIGSVLFVALLNYESSKINKHYKRRKEIEKRKKLKEAAKNSQLPIS